MTARPIRRALLSASDKTGLADLATALVELGVELVSTGGTRRALAEAGLRVRDVSTVTGFPEILDGRVKTLHPAIHAGILARRSDAAHLATLGQHDITPIDLVAVNLYPFEQVVAEPGAATDEIIENIDIGGPTLIRAAAKNHEDVVVLTDPAQYPEVIRELRENQGRLSLDTRRRLALAAFERTARYDAAISAWFAGGATEPGPFPPRLELSLERRASLRYGENPHQQAAFYVEPAVQHACVASAEVLHGKELSYNNLLDLDSALNLVREFARPAACVVKHNNPCGAAIGDTLEEAFRRAYDGDPQSAYGGILAFNRPLDAATATQVSEPGRFVECVIAPGFDEEAFTILTTRPSWKNSVRLLRTGPLGPLPAGTLDYRRIDGGLLAQTRDVVTDDLPAAKLVTKRAPTDAERADLAFAWVVCKHVKSNAIVLARAGQVVGVGAGQMSRLDSVQIALRKAGDRAKGSVLASDAFFPFRDNVDATAPAGVSAVIQPGGSKRDNDSITACDEHGLAMLFTGVRHFRH